MSGLYLLVGSVVAARARVAGVVEVAAGVVVGAAVEVVEIVELVAAVGVVAGVGALVAVVVAAVGVAVVAVVGVVAIRVELFRGEVLAVASGSNSSVGARPLRPSSFPHTHHRCFSRLDDAWRTEFGDEAECPRWEELLRSGVGIFDLDYDAIRAAMYAFSVGAEGDCYPAVLSNPGIEAAAVSASESALPGIAPAEALHTLTLHSGASCCFFCNTTTLTPLSAPIQVRLVDPSRGPLLVRSSTILPCPAYRCLQDAMVTTTTPGGQHVLIFMCTQTCRHLATFTRRPRSSLYTLATKPPQVAASAQVSASCPVAPLCSCRLLSHQNLLWHHHLGHPSLPRLHGMHSRLLVSGLPRSLPPLPPSPSPPCLPCVEGRQRATPHSSFPPTTAPLQTLHMDLWGPACVTRQGRERYFPLLRERFRQDLPVLHLHSDRDGEFSSDLLQDFCRGESILPSFTLLASSQENGIAERRIGLVMDVARTSMIHAAAPHFLWPLAFYHPTSRCVLPSHDVTFDESVPFYRLFPYRSAPLPPRRSSSLQVPLR
ncbi:unnamed protein product [Closterium sp. NIES-54]